MYRFMEKRKVLSLFAEANRGHWLAIVNSLAPRFEYRFVGDTPLGGTRTTHAAMRRWFERVYRLLPSSQFVPLQVVVQGLPWKTTIMTHMRMVGMVPSLSGQPTHSENEFMSA